MMKSPTSASENCIYGAEKKMDRVDARTFSTKSTQSGHQGNCAMIASAPVGWQAYGGTTGTTLTCA
jgi:hypothetical protein